MALFVTLAFATLAAAGEKHKFDIKEPADALKFKGLFSGFTPSSASSLSLSFLDPLPYVDDKGNTRAGLRISGAAPTDSAEPTAMFLGASVPIPVPESAVAVFKFKLEFLARVPQGCVATQLPGWVKGGVATFDPADVNVHSVRAADGMVTIDQSLLDIGVASDLGGAAAGLAGPLAHSEPTGCASSVFYKVKIEYDHEAFGSLYTFRANMTAPVPDDDDDDKKDDDDDDDGEIESPDGVLWIVAGLDIPAESVALAGTEPFDFYLLKVEVEQKATGCVWNGASYSEGSFSDPTIQGECSQCKCEDDGKVECCDTEDDKSDDWKIPVASFTAAVAVGAVIFVGYRHRRSASNYSELPPVEAQPIPSAPMYGAAAPVPQQAPPPYRSPQVYQPYQQL